MSVKRLLGLPLLSVLLISCVTINIYFPAAAAEEAARTIVRDVLGTDGTPPATAPAVQPQSGLEPVNPLVLLVGRLLEWSVPVAHAEANIDINSPAIRTLRQRMSGRQGDLAPYYQSGAIGFGRDGFVEVRDLAAVPLKERTQAKKLAADENEDRQALYREIARANGHPEWEKDVRQTFARVWAEEARSGYWYQDAGGAWKQR